MPVLHMLNYTFVWKKKKNLPIVASMLSNLPDGVRAKYVSEKNGGHGALTESQRLPLALQKIFWIDNVDSSLEHFKDKNSKVVLKFETFKIVPFLLQICASGMEIWFYIGRLKYTVFVFEICIINGQNILFWTY